MATTKASFQPAGRLQTNSQWLLGWLDGNNIRGVISRDSPSGYRKGASSRGDRKRHKKNGVH